jgi:hypothetical protein
MTLRAVLAHATYRYWLLRAWDSARPTVGFVMLNPSAADAVVDVPAVGRCVRCAQTWGYGSRVAVNLFAYRTVRPKRLSEVADPMGRSEKRTKVMKDGAHRVTRNEETKKKA